MKLSNFKFLKAVGSEGYQDIYASVTVTSRKWFFLKKEAIRIICKQMNSQRWYFLDTGEVLDLSTTDKQADDLYRAHRMQEKYFKT